MFALSKHPDHQSIALFQESHVTSSHLSNILWRMQLTTPDRQVSLGTVAVAAMGSRQQLTVRDALVRHDHDLKSGWLTALNRNDSVTYAAIVIPHGKASSVPNARHFSASVAFTGILTLI
jgi:hypothetical protein